jgi:hypothetical protein
LTTTSEVEPASGKIETGPIIRRSLALLLTPGDQLTHALIPLMDAHTAIVARVEEANRQQPLEEFSGLAIVEHGVRQNLSIDVFGQDTINRIIQRPGPQRRQTTNHHAAMLTQQK